MRKIDLFQVSLHENLNSPDESEVADFLTPLLDQSDSLYAKKLSRNDRDWARFPNKHQNGIYVPAADRDGGFFPSLSLKVRDKPDADAIFEAFLDIEWPSIRVTRKARIVHFTSKGEETHLTRLPKQLFAEAPPASLLVVGRKDDRYKALIVHPDSDEYETVHDVLSLTPDFRSGTFIPANVRKVREDRTLSFIEEVFEAFFNGVFPALAERYSHMPTTVELATIARERYLQENSLNSLNPYGMDRPGDALRAISRGLEYEIFRDYQVKARSIELARIILGDDPDKANIRAALKSIVLNFPQIDALLLSAAQQRKSRAGYSFEHHIEAMLDNGGVPFDKQVVLEAKKRPDFILPSRAVYEKTDRERHGALVLSAKTTLRERWKQVGGEMRNCDLYLATVDEGIAVNAIEDMASQGIFLVVPESLKDSDTTEYKGQRSVISFKEFFEEAIPSRIAIWENEGIFFKKP